MNVWVQKWEESERGWGCRPDGHTLHLEREHIELFLRNLRKRETEDKPSDYVPAEYSRPCGTPYLTALSNQDLIAHLKASDFGIWKPYPTPITPEDGRDG